MKNKKIIGLTLSFAAMLGLASCGGNSEEELKAVEKALSMSIATNLTSGNPLVEGMEAEFTGDSNDAASVTFKQITKVNGKTYTVNLDWEVDSEYATIKDLDETHKKIEFNYPNPLIEEDQEKEDNGEDVGNVHTQLKVTASCGSASKSAAFDVKLTHITHFYDTLTIKDIYKLNEAGDNFDFYDTTAKKIKTNYNQSYFYVITSGKLIYKSPDSNWGILADGKYAIELYQLVKCSDNANAVVGNYITVKADIAQYNGNIQLSYVTQITIMDDHSNIAEPEELGVLSSNMNTSGADGYMPFYSPIHNAIGTLKGVTVENVNAFDSFDGQTRFTFTVLYEGKEFIIAHDYHTVKGADGKFSSDMINAWKSVLTTASSIDITGTIRYNGSGIGAGGHWEIIPFLTEHIVASK